MRKSKLNKIFTVSALSHVGSLDSYTKFCIFCCTQALFIHTHTHVCAWSIKTKAKLHGLAPTDPKLSPTCDCCYLGNLHILFYSVQNILNTVKNLLKSIFMKHHGCPNCFNCLRMRILQICLTFIIA